MDTISCPSWLPLPCFCEGALACPSWPYLLIQIGNYAFAVAVLTYAWRRAPYLAFTIIAAMLFGFAVEYQALTNAQHPYHYTQALITLPGGLPLGVDLSWGIIMFAALSTARALGAAAGVQPLIAGFLAVSIDLGLDPSFVAMDFWVWAQPGPWFGIPWANYVGWFTIVVTFTAANQLAFHYYPPGRSKRRDALVALLATVPAFLVFAAVMAGYEWLTLKAGVPDVVVMTLLFAACALPVVAGIRGYRRDTAPQAVILAVPGYFYLISLVALFGSGLYSQYQPLVVIVPTVAALGSLAYVWPYLDRLLPAPGTRGQSA